MIKGNKKTIIFFDVSAIAFLKNNSLHINAFYNWSGCTKLSLRATWTLVASQLSWLERLNRIQWLWVQVPSQSGQLSIAIIWDCSVVNTICISSFRYADMIYLYKISIKWAWRLTKAMAEMKSNTEQVMKLEWLLKVGSDWSWTHGQRAQLVKFSEGNTVVLGLNTTQANFLQLLSGDCLGMNTIYLSICLSIYLSICRIYVYIYWIYECIYYIYII